MTSSSVMEGDSRARLELSERIESVKKNSSGSSLGSLKEDDIDFTGSEEIGEPMGGKATFYLDDDGLDESLGNGISSVSRGENSSGSRRARSQLLQLFTCQNCCKRRRSPRTSKNKAHSSSDPNSTSSSSNSLKIYQAGGIDSSNLLSVNSILTRLSPSDQDDDDSDGVGSKKAPRRSEKSKRPGRRSPIEMPGLLTSILKNRHSPSPIRGDTVTHQTKDTPQSSVDPTGKQKAPPPIRVWETESTNSHTHLEPPVVNSVLARCARLKNQSLYGSFSFQKAELQKFNASLAVTVEADVFDEEVSSPSHRSLSESSSGSGSPFPWLFGGSCANISNKSSTGGKRARFNEAVDVIVDDQRSGRLVFKNIVRLKPSDDSVIDSSLRGQHDGRQRLPSDSSEADFTLAALRCRRRQRAFGEARISIIPAAGRSTGKGRVGSSRRASADKSSSNPRQEAPTLRVAIRLKEDFTRDRVFVRSARGGTRLLVGTYRPEPLGDGTNYLRQFVDRYSLPHAIDVTTVTATLGADDSPDDLVITAKLFDYESEDCD